MGPHRYCLSSRWLCPLSHDLLYSYLLWTLLSWYVTTTTAQADSHPWCQNLVHFTFCDDINYSCQSAGSYHQWDSLAKCRSIRNHQEHNVLIITCHFFDLQPHNYKSQGTCVGHQVQPDAGNSSQVHPVVRLDNPILVRTPASSCSPGCHCQPVLKLHTLLTSHSLVSPAYASCHRPCFQDQGHHWVRSDPGC